MRGMDDPKNWEKCSVCHGHGPVYDIWITGISPSGVITTESGYIDCKNPACNYGLIYVGVKERNTRNKNIIHEKLEAARGKPVTLGDAFPDVFHKMRGAILQHA